MRKTSPCGSLIGSRPATGDPVQLQGRVGESPGRVSFTGDPAKHPCCYQKAKEEHKRGKDVDRPGSVQFGHSGWLSVERARNDQSNTGNSKELDRERDSASFGERSLQANADRQGCDAECGEGRTYWPSIVPEGIVTCVALDDIHRGAHEVERRLPSLHSSMRAGERYH